MSREASPKEEKPSWEHRERRLRQQLGIRRDSETSEEEHLRRVLVSVLKACDKLRPYVMGCS